MSQASTNWTEEAEYIARVRSKLDVFNATIGSEALELYNSTVYRGDNFMRFATMVSDVRFICPLQELAMVRRPNVT